MNKYEEKNKAYFDEIIDIVNSNPVQYSNIIRGKKYLIEWINSVLPLLNDKKYELRTKVYWIINNIENFPKCKNYNICHNDFSNRNIRGLKIGYGTFCSSKCTNSDKDHNEKIINTRKQHMIENPNFLENIAKKIRATKLERYGDETYTNRKKASETCNERYGKNWFVQTDIFKEKSAQTCFKHYGVDQSFKSKICREKSKKTCLERYGDPNYRNREQIIKTFIERYGVDNPAKSEKIKEKARKTFIEHYGVDNNMKSDIGYSKWQKSMIEKYGKDHNWKLDSCKKTIKQTLLTKYNMEHTPSWKYIYDEKSFDSSWELAYYIWLKDNNENFEYPCETHFQYLDAEGKQHTYIPDFKVNNQIIEIKGSHFLDSKTGLKSPYYKNKNYNNSLIDGKDPKYKCIIDNNVKILSLNEIKPYIEYVEQKYGKNYLKKFKKL